MEGAAHGAAGMRGNATSGAIRVAASDQLPERSALGLPVAREFVARGLQRLDVVVDDLARHVRLVDLLEALLRDVGELLRPGLLWPRRRADFEAGSFSGARGVLPLVGHAADRLVVVACRLRG